MLDQQKEMSNAEHRERHVVLHQHLDELVADWIGCTHCLPSDASVMDLMKWSHEQTKNPAIKRHSKKESYVAKKDNQEETSQNTL